MLFYSLSFYTLFVMAGIVKFIVPDAVYAFMPLTKGGWWFMEVYVMLYLLHPYINIMLRNLAKADYEKMLLLLGLFWSVMPTFANSYLASGALAWFVYLYSIAGYIRLWADDFGSKKYILFSLVLVMINFMIVIIFDVIGLRIKMFAEHPLHWYNMQMLPTLVIPVCMFIGFKHLNVKYSRVINFIASATLGVYLIHSDKFVSKFLWRTLFRNASFQDSPYLIAYSVAITLTVYVGCTLVELSRAKLFRMLSLRRAS